MTSKSSLVRSVTKRPFLSVTVNSMLTRVTSTVMRVGSSAARRAAAGRLGGFCSAARSAAPSSAQAATRARSFICINYTWLRLSATWSTHSAAPAKLPIPAPAATPPRSPRRSRAAESGSGARAGSSAPVGVLRLPARRTACRPTTGWPMLDRCTRIWCVRPVPMRTSSSVNPAKRRSTRYSLHAARPSSSRAVMRDAPHRIARDRALDPAGLRLHFAVHQRQVDLLHLPAGELVGQRAVRRVVLGHQQHAAGEAVQPVHDARPQRAAHSRKRREAVQQRIHQRARMHARAGVHHHAGGLVDGHHVGVFVEHRAAGSSSAVACSGGGLGGLARRSSRRRAACRTGATAAPLTSTRPLLIQS